MPPQVTPQAAKAAKERSSMPSDSEFLGLDQALLDGKRNFDVPAVVRRQYVEGVVAAYKKLGWQVRLISDQRDGDYIQFNDL